MCRVHIKVVAQLTPYVCVELKCCEQPSLHQNLLFLWDRQRETRPESNPCRLTLLGPVCLLTLIMDQLCSLNTHPHITERHVQYICYGNIHLSIQSTLSILLMKLTDPRGTLTTSGSCCYTHSKNRNFSHFIWSRREGTSSMKTNVFLGNMTFCSANMSQLQV